MMRRMFAIVVLGALLTALAAASDGTLQDGAAPLKVVATIPDLGALAGEIGGDQVTVSVLAKGTEDAHFVEAKPSFIKLLSQADVYLQVGMELELGYAPLLLQNARNGRILPSGEAHIDCSVAIKPLDVPKVQVDRSMGDVHPFGNPHYLTDPLNGLRVADLIRERLARLRPAKAPYFQSRYDSFRQRIGEALVGKELAKKYDFEKLATLHENGKLIDFLKKKDEDKQLGGWIGAMAPYMETKVVVDHNLWSYFARRFGFVVLATLEPKPGVQPTTGHLNEVIKTMKAENVKVILSAPYYDPRHAKFVSENTGAKVLSMAHEVGAREGAGDYFSMIDYDVKQIVTALGGK